MSSFVAQIQHSCVHLTEYRRSISLSLNSSVYSSQSSFRCSVRRVPAPVGNGSESSSTMVKLLPACDSHLYLRGGKEIEGMGQRRLCSQTESASQHRDCAPHAHTPRASASTIIRRGLTALSRRLEPTSRQPSSCRLPGNPSRNRRRTAR